MADSQVLLIGSDRVAQSRLVDLLRERGYDTRTAGSRAEATAALTTTEFAFTLVDARPDGLAGPAALEPLKIQRRAAGSIILLSDDGEIDPAVEALALDADHIIRGSPPHEDLETAIPHVEARPRHPSLGIADPSPAISLRREIALWRSDKMQQIWEIIQQAANIDVTVLISGETGTGKDLVARAIHYLSSRQHAPYVAVNCAAVPKDLLESELFGHERGAFTGAHQLKVGKFESANHGTILLDEIGELHPDLQAKLLHVLQDGTFSRVGGSSPMKADVRVLAATNRDLALAVATNRFRDDLYYRLNVIDIVVPPLRERPEEIPLLAAYFMKRYSKLYHRPSPELSQKVLSALMRHQYPGNVRELENIIKRLIVLGSATLAKTPAPSKDAPRPNSTSPDPAQPSAVFLKDIARKAARRAEQEQILRTLEQTRWNRGKAAKLLNISYRSLLYKMKDAGLSRSSPIVGLGV